MKRSCASFRAALFLGALSIVLSASSLAADEKAKPEDDGLVERKIAVTALSLSPSAANELVEVCFALIEPASWDLSGGKGSIKAGRRTMTVTNTAAVANRIRVLVAALARMPMLDEKSAATAPKTPRVDVVSVDIASIARPERGPTKSAGSQKPANDAAERTTMKLSLYLVADLVWFDDKTAPEFDNLTYLIEACAGTESWLEFGGNGAMKPFPSRGVLVVYNTSEALAAIDAMLAGIRRLPMLTDFGKKPMPVETIPLEQKLGPNRDAEARLYHVADLAMTGGISANFNPIMQRLMDDAAPQTWQRNGGDGMIFKLIDRGSLAIINTPEAHRAIEAELAKMRTELAEAPVSNPATPTKRKAK